MFIPLLWPTNQLINVTVIISQFTWTILFLLLISIFYILHHKQIIRTVYYVTLLDCLPVTIKQIKSHSKCHFHKICNLIINTIHTLYLNYITGNSKLNSTEILTAANSAIQKIYHSLQTLWALKAKPNFKHTYYLTLTINSYHIHYYYPL